MSTTSDTTATLRTVTETVEPPADVLAWLGTDGFAWLRDGDALVTSGVAAAVPVDAVASTLRAIDGDAIACGALPFMDTNDGMLVIPSRFLRVRDGQATVTHVLGADVAAPPKYATTPLRFTVAARQGLAEWDDSVATALAMIEAGTIDKVVLAREVEVIADHAFSVPEVLATLARTQPGCFVYAHGGFVGASPELLVRRSAERVVSMPMAGTVARQASIEADRAIIEALRVSMKDNAEHRYVVEAVEAALAQHCTDIVISDAEPVPLATVTHLTTRIAARLRAPGATALDLALALHPTPAVGGTPKLAALDAIARIEPFERGCYAGPVGWVDANGDGEFAVALRCADLNGTTARLVAGVGIVDGSDPDLEWAETQAKLEPMLRALVRP